MQEYKEMRKKEGEQEQIQTAETLFAVVGKVTCLIQLCTHTLSRNMKAL